MHRRGLSGMARALLGALGVWGAWGALGLLGAREAQAVDLLTVVEQATDHDANLAALRAGSRAAREALPKARAAFLPQVAGGWGRAYNSTAMDGYPRNTYWQNGWSVTLTQPVFDWSRWTVYKQADVVAARGVVEVASAQQTAMLQAVRAYFDELAAEDELARADDYAATLDAHFDQLRRRQAAGEATVIDLQEAEAARGQAQLQQQDARSDLQLRRQTLEQLTGQSFVALSRLADAAAMPRLESGAVEDWTSQAEAHDYTVQLKQIDRRLAELEVEKARAQHLPVVSVSATHTPAGAASGYSRPTTTTTAMLSITIPFFEGGGTNATIDEKRALDDKAQDELLDAQRRAAASARDSWTRFRAGVARVDTLTRLMQSSRAALAATQVGYKVGSRTSTDVLRASDTLYANRRDLIRARYAAVVTLLQLKAATAALDFDEVARVNALLVGSGAGEGEVGRSSAEVGAVAAFLGQSAPVSASAVAGVQEQRGALEPRSIAPVSMIAEPVSASGSASTSGSASSTTSATASASANALETWRRSALTAPLNSR